MLVVIIKAAREEVRGLICNFVLRLKLELKATFTILSICLMYKRCWTLKPVSKVLIIPSVNCAPVISN